MLLFLLFQAGSCDTSKLGLGQKKVKPYTKEKKRSLVDIIKCCCKQVGSISAADKMILQLVKIKLAELLSC